MINNIFQLKYGSYTTELHLPELIGMAIPPDWQFKVRLLLFTVHTCI